MGRKSGVKRLSPRELLSASSGQLTARCRLAFTDGVIAGSELGTDCPQRDRGVNHPTHAWVARDCQMNVLPSTVGQDDEDIERCEPNRVDGEKVDGPGDIQVIPREWQPCGGLL